MKRSQFFNLYNKLQGVKYHTDSVKFSYALIKNIKTIELEIQKLNESIIPSDDFLKFEQERIQVCQDHTQKDENGDPIVIDNEFQIENQEEFNIALLPIKEKYGRILQLRQNQIDAYNRMLDEKIEMDLILVGVDELPKEMTPNELEDIYPILA